jgi:hypothetical protein
MVTVIALAGCALPRENPVEWWANAAKRDGDATADLISVSARVSETKEPYVVRFRLINQSRVPLRLRPHQLPWGNPYSIDVFVLTNDGDIVPPAHVIADSPRGQPPMTIQPGQTLEGDFRIDHRVLRQPLHSALEDKDVLFVWRYRQTTADAQVVGPVSGVVVISRRK